MIKYNNSQMQEKLNWLKHTLIKSKSYITKKNIGYLIFVIFMIFILSPNEKEVQIETVKAQVADLVDEVSVTGSVKPIRQADLAFEVSGKVTAVKVVENQNVKAGDVLFELQRNSLFAQAQSAQAQVEIEQARIGQYESQVSAELAKLADLKAGAKPAEILLKETQVDSAETRLKDAELDYQNTLKSAESELDLKYINLIAGINDSFNTAYNSLLSLTDIQVESFYNSSMETYRMEIAKANAAEILIGAKDAHKWSSRAISTQEGGLKSQIRNLTMDTPRTEIDTIANELSSALNQLNIAFNEFEMDATNYDLHSTEITTQLTAVNGSTTSLATLKNAIVTQKNTNESNTIAKAKALNDAASNLTESNSNLNLSKASASTKAIEAQQASVDQSQANLRAQKASLKAARARLNDVYAQLNTRVLRAPYDGIVTNIDIEIGEIAFGNTTIAQILGDGSYEIIADIPETDISKVQTDNQALVSLDAYSDESLQAVVTNINEAAETVDGVPVYEITLRFTQEYDFVKSGMTANIDILVDESAGVVSVPIRAVEDGKIRILLENGVVELRSVETGLRSSDGLIEVLSGVAVDEDVVIFMEDDEK